MLQHAEHLIKLSLPFKQSVEQVTSQYFKTHRQLGARDRALLLDTLFQVIREKNLLKHWASQSSAPAGVPLERKLAILGWQGTDHLLQRYLTEAEKKWLEVVEKESASSRTTLPFSVKYSLPEWLVTELQSLLPEQELDAFALSMLQNATLDLRVNPLKNKIKEVAEQLNAAGITTQLTPYAKQGLRVEGKPNLTQHPLYLDGSFEIQDEGSQLLAQIVCARRNELVIDYCAGAGGKTFAMGAAMRNTGRLYAWDRSAHRLNAIHPRLEKSGLTNLMTAAITGADDIRVKRLWGKADRVLVDAPCSGLGTLRRSPDLKWRQTPQSIEEVQNEQMQILAGASPLVKKGGLLVYATCSFLRQENEVVAEAFQKQHPEFRPYPILELLKQQKIDPAEQLVKGDYLRLWPHRHQTDGFFAAVWIKER